MKTKPNKRKKQLKGSNKRAITIICLLVICLIASAAGNVTQFLDYQKLETENNDVSWRLNNYRELQETQIRAVKDSCATLNAETYNTSSVENQIVTYLSAYNSQLGKSYIITRISSCYGPLFLASGVAFREDLETSEVDNMVLEPGSNYEIREDAFDNVKW